MFSFKSNSKTSDKEKNPNAAEFPGKMACLYMILINKRV